MNVLVYFLNILKHAINEAVSIFEAHINILFNIKSKVLLCK